jgi:exodeoxyribonuclease VII small subunit
MKGNSCFKIMPIYATMVHRNVKRIGNMTTKQTFEDSMKKLEELVKSMENGEVTLDESLKLFEEGSALAKKCQQNLKDVETKVEKILVENGEIKTVQ